MLKSYWCLCAWLYWSMRCAEQALQDSIAFPGFK